LEGVDWAYLAEDRGKCTLMKRGMNFQIPLKFGNLLD